MGRGLAIIITLLFLVPLAYAVTGPIAYQGKEYYVVTATDPSEDTGNEVCAKVGKVCMGFTDTTGTVCGLAHPSAAAITSGSGDVSTVYCDGAPQSGVCATNQNTCVSCPTCTIPISCDEAIGGLYREMFVECQAPSAGCPVTMLSRATNQFFNEIPSLNTQLAGCPTNLPAGSNFLLGTGNIRVDVTRSSGTISTFTVQVQNKQINGISAGATTCSQKITISESVLDSILQSRDRGAAVMRAYTNKQFTVSGCSVMRRIGNFFAQPIGRLIISRQTPPPPPPSSNCGALGEQCNNRGCQSGLSCGSPPTIQGQRNVYNQYSCIDQNTYQANCIGRGNTPPAWSCYASSYGC